MKKKLLVGLLFPILCSSQVGVNTATPQKTLHVNGSLQLVSELNVGGNATTPGLAGTAGQYLVSKGSGASPEWKNFAGIVPNSNGSVIAINGELVIAQEIIALMTGDFTTNSTPPVPIGNLNNVIIDNQNTFTASTTTNSFTVGANGIYSINFNIQYLSNVVSNVGNGGGPVFGVWDDTNNLWVARINSSYNTANRLQDTTLLTSIQLSSAKTYSFRVSTSGTSGETLIIKAMSSGGTGSGPVTQISMKRLK